MNVYKKPDMISMSRRMASLGVIGILGTVGMLAFLKLVIGPMYKKKKLEIACEYGESLMQMEAEKKQSEFDD